MKKILFLVTQSEFGGAQRYIYEVCRGLDLKKYEILVAAGSGDGELFRKLENTHCSHTAGVQPRYLKQMRRTPWPWQMVLAIREIYSLLKKEKPDVLFLCSTTAGLLGSIASKIYKLKTKNYKLKTIYRIGGWAFCDPRPWWINKIIFWAEKLTARFKDIIIVNSQYDWRIAVKKKIISPEKIFKIYNGLDVDSLDFLPEKEARNALQNYKLKTINYKLIGTVANFYKTKGLEYLIEAAKKMGPVPNFVIIGEGRLRPRLESLIKKYRLENQVFLVGKIPDAYKYLKAFDTFVLPSLKEGFPWITLEAMAAELPIVATNVGALPEIIEDGVDGFLIEPKNNQALAEKINWFFDHQAEAQIMGEKAKEKVTKKFPLQKMIQETEKLLQ